MDSEPLLASEALPRGFQFAAVTAGIKQSGRPDFAVAVADKAATGAAMFTGNRVVAAPVTVGRKHLDHSSGHVRVVAVNSGNANCVTGQAGFDACLAVCQAAAETFQCSGYEVFPSSTGIIGVPLPAEKLVAALPRAQSDLAADADGFSRFARAILTTDTRPKVASQAIEIGGQQIRLAGCAKGAGMIHPQLVPHATMLVYLFTDAAIDPSLLQQLLTSSAELSFNRISIDGDTSTNDTVLLLASGASGVSIDSRDAIAFRAALDEVCTSLAKQIVADGEGVTHVVELEVNGADSDSDALRIAKAIAHSPLVKTAWAGSDPNWGRILAAIGYSGAAIDTSRIGLWFGEHEICIEGGRSPRLDEAAAHHYLKQSEFRIRVELGVGAGHCRFWTCDFTAEYVRINADYST